MDCLSTSPIDKFALYKGCPSPGSIVSVGFTVNSYLGKEDRRHLSFNLLWLGVLSDSPTMIIDDDAVVM